jgi:hypothetical protein
MVASVLSKGVEYEFADPLNSIYTNIGLSPQTMISETPFGEAFAFRRGLFFMKERYLQLCAVCENAGVSSGIGALYYGS